MDVNNAHILLFSLVTLSCYQLRFWNIKNRLDLAP